MNTLRSFMLSAICLSLAACAYTSPHIDFLGGSQIEPASEGRTIRVANDVRYRALRLCVEDAPLAIQTAVIAFGDWGEQPAAIDLLIEPGQCTHWIQFRGRDDRPVDSVFVTYAPPAAGGAAALVKAYGKR